MLFLASLLCQENFPCFFNCTLFPITISALPEATQVETALVYFCLVNRSGEVELKSPYIPPQNKQ